MSKSNPQYSITLTRIQVEYLNRIFKNKQLEDIAAMKDSHALDVSLRDKFSQLKNRIKLGLVKGA